MWAWPGKCSQGRGLTAASPQGRERSRLSAAVHEPAVYTVHVPVPGATEPTVAKASLSPASSTPTPDAQVGPGLRASKPAFGPPPVQGGEAIISFSDSGAVWPSLSPVLHPVSYNPWEPAIPLFGNLFYRNKNTGAQRYL